MKLNGHPVSGRAVLEATSLGNKRIWAAITVPPGSPIHQTAREAVLANDLEVNLEGKAHDRLEDAFYDFRAEGQLVNGRVGSDIKADFISTKFVKLPSEAG